MHPEHRNDGYIEIEHSLTDNMFVGSNTGIDSKYSHRQENFSKVRNNK